MGLAHTLTGGEILELRRATAAVDTAPAGALDITRDSSARMAQLLRREVPGQMEAPAQRGPAETQFPRSDDGHGDVWQR